MLNIVEGWTERIRYRLSADGVTLSLVGMSVNLVANTRSGAKILFAGTAGIEDAPNGVVYFDATAGDFTDAVTTWMIRWKVTDGAGKIAFFPAGDPEAWNIAKT